MALVSSLTDNYTLSDQNTINILLVEDNLVNQLVATRLLSQWGWVVTIANHGKEALELIHKKCFKIVLMDIQMPEMDGCEATNHIRSMEDPYFKNIPIIAFTASTVADTKEKAKSLGMNDFLNKPFTPEEMHTKIMYYLTKKDHTLRPLHVNFDQYAVDGELKVELLALMISSIQELQSAIHTAKNATDLQSAFHKIKSTVTLLEDREFSEAVDALEIALLQDEGNAPEKVEAFNVLCESILRSLDNEIPLD